jgi:predicted dehydrogenase
MKNEVSDTLPDADSYALVAEQLDTFEAPTLAYQPPMPHHFHPRIAVVGAGGIVPAHLDAYQQSGFDVAAICNRTLPKAVARRDEFFPHAIATDCFDDVLQDNAIDVLDITTHPEDRIDLMERAIRAGKHVLSQKPFVTDLAVGERLVRMAEENGVKLAVNQNGRWAPHMAWMRAAVEHGLIGTLISSHSAVHWDHSWIAGTPFEKMEDLILFDFGIHWFDFIASLAPGRIQSVFAVQSFAAKQKVNPPLLAQVVVTLDQGQASLVFDGANAHGPHYSTFISGSAGSLASNGPDLGQQQVSLTTAQGRACPTLEGKWFNDGFRGAMGELLCAIEEDREPQHSAARNLYSLALTFAAVESARHGVPVVPGDIRRLPG